MAFYAIMVGYLFLFITINLTMTNYINNQNEKKTKQKPGAQKSIKSKVSSLCAWFFSILIILMIIGVIKDGEQGLSIKIIKYLVIVALLLPPLTKYLRSNFNISVHPIFKIILIVLLLLIGNPPDSEHYNREGLRYSKQENYAVAEKQFSKAIEMNPNFIAAYLNKGAALFSMGRYKKSIDTLNAALFIDPQEAKDKHVNKYLSKVEKSLMSVISIEECELLPTYIENSTTERDNCILNYAMAHEDKSACDNLNMYINRLICVVAFNNKECDLEFCNNVDFLDKGLNDQYNDKNQIDRNLIDYKKMCIKKIVFDGMCTLELCNKSEFKTECEDAYYFAESSRNFDLEICNNIRNEYDKKLCIGNYQEESLRIKIIDYKIKEEECYNISSDMEAFTRCRRQLYEMQDDVNLYNYFLKKSHDTSVGFQECEALAGWDSIFCKNRITNQMNENYKND